MSGKDLSSVIGSFYEAGSGGADWHSAGRELFRLIGVDSGSLRLRHPDGRLSNALQPVVPLETQYFERFRHIDPIHPIIQNIAVNGDWAAAVRTDDEVLPKPAFIRTQFYQEFARPLGRNHLLVGGLDDAETGAILLFRDSRPFGEEDKELLAALLPHIQRAVQMYRRLRDADLSARIGSSALEAMPGGAIVVDAELSVLAANTGCERMLAAPGAPLALVRDSSPSAPLARRLVVMERSNAGRLRALVADAASGGAGGAMRLEYDDGSDDGVAQLAVLVAPESAQFVAAQTAFGAARPVLVLLKELSRPSAPPPSLLSDLFGLSIAEAAVALALLGGQTAEHVARDRSVSLETVRSQIRTVLRKSEAANLRDFERIGALLATLRR